MEIKIRIPTKALTSLHTVVSNILNEKLVVLTAFIFAAAASWYSYSHDLIVAYGDAESHLNIAKRVISSITPGAAQLGGIWLPIPHIFLIPFVANDFLWRTGLAGSIVSGICFIISGVFIYKTTFLITENKEVSFLSFLIFAINPNILYLQSTPMTEIVLIMFFIISTYFFLRYIYNQNQIIYLVFAAFFGFCASLSRYDGWFLVLFEAAALAALYIRNRKMWKELEGKLIIFCTLAFFGIFLWFLWDWLILGDPLFFTNSQFSAKTQQMNWKSRGELPAYHNLFLSFAYYFVTAMSNSGLLLFLASIGGLALYLKRSQDKKKYFIAVIMLVPFIFNVTTLFLGQSVIFIPHLTPTTFEWTLFNVRYGAMMVPVVAVFFAYLFKKQSIAMKTVLTGIVLMQIGLFVVGYSPVISLADGTVGLSRAKRPDAEGWIKKHYDGGLVLMDDYARTISIVRSGIPMQNTIYIGNAKYWEESFYTPEKYATWIIMQRNDAVYEGIYAKPQMQARLFKYYNKVYTSPEILIFRRMSNGKK